MMPDTSQIIPIVMLILGLGVAWLVVRFVFKLARRVFVLGCVGIVILGLIVYLGAGSF